jgi:ATP-dependent DNA helicase RecG
MFDDKLVVESPGGFAGLVTAKNIYETCYRRNWWLTAALKLLGYVLCENEGAKRIRIAMKSQNLPDPVFEQKQANQASVRVTLKNEKPQRAHWVDAEIAGMIPSHLLANLTEMDRRVINFAAENNRRIKVVQAQNLLPRPRWHTANNLLNRLAKMGLFRKVSQYPRDPTAYFALTNKVKQVPPPKTPN